LVVCAAAGAVVALLQKRADMGLRMARSASFKAEAELAKKSLLSQMSCARTFSGLSPATVCNNSTAIPLKPHTGSFLASPLVGAGGVAVYGDWHAHATCDYAQKTLVLCLGKIKDGQWVKDPVTEQPMSFGGMPINPVV